MNEMVESKCKQRSAKCKQSISKKEPDIKHSGNTCTKHLKNLEECLNDLKSNTLKTRKCYSAFKLFTYFSGNKEFTTSFGCLLGEVENVLEKMAEIFKKPQVEPIDAVKKELFKKSLHNNELTLVQNGVLLHSLTPPPSEIGSDEQSMVNSSGKGKKRRTNDGKPAGSSPIKKKKNNDIDEKLPLMDNDSPEKRLRQKNNLPVDPLEKEFKNTPLNEVKNENIEGKEYEVEFIKDFVRKQGKEFFTVSWKGYGAEDDTLEPVEHLFECDSIMEDFFIKRIEQRNSCQDYEVFKCLQFPLDNSVKEVLFNSFKTFFKDIDVKEVVTFSTSNKLVPKTKEELSEFVQKVAAYRESSLEKYTKLFHNLKMHFGMYILQPDREKQLAHVRSWERSINVICSDPSPINVENNVDLNLPPFHFVYINNQKAGPDINIPKDPPIGCKCTDCNNNQNNCCPKGMGSHFCYTKYGRLKVSLGTPIYECNKLCACSQDCPNRVVQKGRRTTLTIFRTDNARGWGVRAQEFIKKDSFVTEYVGEVISSEEAEQRGMKYDAIGCTYLFDLDYNKGDMNPYTIDAAKYGNVSHFINHCCDPNLVVFNVWVNCLDPDLPRLALFASRDIKRGEELTFDYNSGPTRQHIENSIIDADENSFISPKKMDSSTLESVLEKNPSPFTIRKNRHAGTTRCLCGAANCRQSFF